VAYGLKPFDFVTGSFADPVVHLARLNGQALVLVP
jgi:hypothetical protein